MKERIEARIQELLVAKEEALGRANAIHGAIQECRYWLAELAKDAQPQEKS